MLSIELLLFRQLLLGLIIAMTLLDSVGGNPKKIGGRGSHARGGMSTETGPSSSTVPPKFKLWQDGPNFDTDLPQNVYALEGKTAYLTCRVFERQNKTISWIRHNDLHILTVGRYTYTADLRYESLYNSERDEWILQIKNVQKRESGRYECQISTQPVRSFFVQLKVVDSLPERGHGLRMNDERRRQQQQHQVGLPYSGLSAGKGRHYQGQVPEAHILGDPEVFIDVGSMLNLTCEVRNSQEQPAFMLWYHGDRTIDYTSPRGGISVITSSNGSPKPTSTLLISSVGPRDSGKYSCQPANAELVSVTVHIIEGEHHAAIHTNRGAALTPHYGLFIGWVQAVTVLLCLTSTLVLFPVSFVTSTMLGPYVVNRVVGQQ